MQTKTFLGEVVGDRALLAGQRGVLDEAKHRIRSRRLARDRGRHVLPRITDPRARQSMPAIKVDDPDGSRFLRAAIESAPVFTRPTYEQLKNAQLVPQRMKIVDACECAVTLGRDCDYCWRQRSLNTNHVSVQKIDPANPDLRLESTGVLPKPDPHWEAWLEARKNYNAEVRPTLTDRWYKAAGVPAIPGGAMKAATFEYTPGSNTLDARMITTPGYAKAMREYGRAQALRQLAKTQSFNMNQFGYGMGAKALDRALTEDAISKPSLVEKAAAIGILAYVAMVIVGLAIIAIFVAITR